MASKRTNKRIRRNPTIYVDIDGVITEKPDKSRYKIEYIKMHEMYQETGNTLWITAVRQYIIKHEYEQQGTLF